MPSTPVWTNPRRILTIGLLLTLAISIGPSVAGASTMGPGRVGCSGAHPTGTVESANRVPRAADRANETRDLDVALGDVAVVPLSVAAGTTTNVTIGAAEGVTRTLRVEDDGDGNVTLLINTYLAADGSTVSPGTYRSRGNDTVTVLDGNNTDPLLPGTYPVSSRSNGSKVDETQLTITEPDATDIAVFRAPPRVFNVSTADELRAVNRSGLVRPLATDEHAPDAVHGETIVIRFDAPSLLGVLAAQPGNTTTERFLAVHDDTTPKPPESVEISGPCGGIHLPGTVAAGGARVLTAPTEGAVYLLLDTASLDGVAAGSQRVSLELSESSRLVQSHRELEAAFGITDLEVSPAGDDATVELSTANNATVTATTNLLPTTRVPIVVRSRVDPDYERRTTATVGDDGRVTATVDLVDASDPGLFTVTIAGEQFPARIGRPPAVHWELEQSYGGAAVDELYVTRLSLPDGGFLAAYAVDRTTGDVRPIGTTAPGEDEFRIDPRQTGQYLLVVAHRDGDSDGTFDGPGTDPPYRVDGQPVGEWVPITANSDSPPASPPPVSPVDALAATERRTPTTVPPTSTPTTEDRERTSPPSETVTTPTRSVASPTPTPSTTPGFGVTGALLAVAIVITDRWLTS